MIDRRPNTVVVTRAQERYSSWMADVLVYTIVLNLFVEYVPAVISESFTISILTAVLLKLMIDALGGVERHVRHFFSAKGTAPARVVGVVVVLAILFTGKLLILEVVNLVFGGRVQLGHFVEVIALIVCMMVARRLMGWTYRSLGANPAESEAPT